MKFLAPVLVLISFATAYDQRDTTTYATRKLFKTNLDCNYQTEMLCKVTRENNMYDDMVTTNLDDEVTYKIFRCCNKMNMFDKKECLKTVRDEVKDVVTNYDTWTTDFNDDKYRSWYDNYDNQFQSTKWFYDNNQYTENWFGRDYTEFDQDDFETGRSRWSSVPDMFRRCNQFNQCRRRLERTTELVARKACRDNTMKDDRGAGDTCCQAGRLVGTMVGRFNEQVCTPALYKFQTKVQGCNLNRKPECRRSFLFCCKQASDLAKKTEMMTETMMTGGTTWL